MTHSFFTSRMILAITLILISFTPALWAEPAAIGQVVWSKGGVKAVAIDHKERALQRRSAIYNKDTIVTDKTGTGQIVFTDNSVVALRADTVLQINDYQFNPKTPESSGKYVATLVKGGFRTVTGLIPKQNSKNYQVNTPVATIGVYGTSYAVVFRGQLWVAYYKGKPCVRNAMGSYCLDDKNRFARVNSSTSAPERMASAPGIFNDQPEITATTALNDSITGTSAGKLGTSGKAQTVGGFCIQ